MPHSFIHATKMKESDDKMAKAVKRTVLSIAFAAVANTYLLVKSDLRFLFAAIPLLLLLNSQYIFVDVRIKGPKCRGLIHGAESLFVFVNSVALSVVVHTVLVISMFSEIKTVLWSALYCYAAHFILFWNGIICVYICSYQLGIKHRVLGALCGPIPVAHLFALRSILKVVSKEMTEEIAKEYLNYERRDRLVCRTKYPLLFVHGVFFRDFKYFNYWGRIPAELKRNGADVYYGNHQSALCIKDSANELAERIKAIVRETGCEKVNVIAHSKGGLDTRYAMKHLGCEQYVASLTTINTPHRGCKFAEHLLSKISPAVQENIASAYNAAAKKLGDTTPDFMAAVKDLTATACLENFSHMTSPAGVFCQSFGSVLENARGGKFPLNFSYHLVKDHDGENDGLVSVESFEYGERCRILYPSGKRGISHADMIDLSRENVDGFDVRELYVEIVSDLKDRGL